jgi:ribosome-binding ATPase YchF (GTP1/OBG family)
VAKLENGQSIAGMKVCPDTERDMKSYQLFSVKPELVVINVGEDKVREAVPASVRELSPHAIALSAALEKDLAELSDEDRPAFMEEMGVKEVARHKVIRGAYDAVNLISFFTVGEDECKAWTISRGTPAVEAAGKIHSDIQRGFIRAEVVAYDDLVRLKTMKDVKSAGLQRLEGKEYIVADGDIINYRFNV